MDPPKTRVPDAIPTPPHPTTTIMPRLILAALLALALSSFCGARAQDDVCNVSLSDSSSQQLADEIADASATEVSVFGEQIVVNVSPVIQLLAPDLLTSQMEVFALGGGTAIVNEDRMFEVRALATPLSFTVVRSTNSFNYRAGQGFTARFTASFENPGVGKVLIAGPFTVTDGVTVGFTDSDVFGVRHRHHGRLPSTVMTITVAAGGGSNTVSVTWNDITTSDIMVTDVSATQNAVEIVAAVLANTDMTDFWRCEQVDNTMVCYALATAPADGTYALGNGGTSLAADFDPLVTGQAPIDDWVFLPDFNGGSDLSWLNTTSMNIYQVRSGYLGAAPTTIYVFNPNGANWVPMHTFYWANRYTTANFYVPRLKPGWAATCFGACDGEPVVRGASTSISVEGSAMADTKHMRFVENDVASISQTPTTVLSIRPRLVYAKAHSLATITVWSISASTGSQRGASFALFKNCALSAPDPTWEYLDEVGSIIEVSTTASDCTGGEPIFSIDVGNRDAAYQKIEDLGIEVSEGDQITVMANVRDGTPADIHISLQLNQES